MVVIITYMSIALVVVGIDLYVERKKKSHQPKHRA